jgi:hypothetical protein
MTLRDDIAATIVVHQPKPIPINMEEAKYIADGILERFDVKEKGSV